MDPETSLELTRNSGISRIGANHVSRHRTRRATSDHTTRGSYETCGGSGGAMHCLASAFVVPAREMGDSFSVSDQRSGVHHTHANRRGALGTLLAERRALLAVTTGPVVNASRDESDWVRLLKVCHRPFGIFLLAAGSLNGRLYGAKEGVGARVLLGIGVRLVLQEV